MDQCSAPPSAASASSSTRAFDLRQEGASAGRLRRPREREGVPSVHQRNRWKRAALRCDTSTVAQCRIRHVDTPCRSSRTPPPPGASNDALTVDSRLIRWARHRCLRLTAASRRLPAPTGPHPRPTGTGQPLQRQLLVATSAPAMDIRRRHRTGHRRGRGRLVTLTAAVRTSLPGALSLACRLTSAISTRRPRQTPRVGRRCRRRSATGRSSGSASTTTRGSGPGRRRCRSRR